MSDELRIPLAELIPGTATRFEVGPPGGLCVVRIGDDVYAIGDRCSHADVSLSEGEVDPEDCWIECWKHGSVFSLTDGEPQSLPATRPVPVFPVTIDEGEVVVKLS